ncbi:hypothetical protein F5B19DRAFT_278998 [Rostrohypoxylon terebratum]|nr:hypothetical protein F5B19DRAFT_278998 [Rostrohypoxylon terebratum]
MFSRLRLEQAPALTKSDSSSLFEMLKHRLYDEGEGEDEEDMPEDVNWNPADGDLEEHIDWEPPRKQRRQSAITHLKNKKGLPSIHEENQPSNRQYGRQRLSHSPDPESPLVKEVEDRYTHLRATLHSATRSSLASVESELVAASESSIKTKCKQMLALGSEMLSLVSPMLNLDVDYMATDEGGHARTVTIAIGAACSALEEKIDSTEAEVNRLWAEWEQSEVEIKEIVSDLGLLSTNEPDSNHTSRDGANFSSSHSKTLAEFDSDLDQAEKEVLEEMAMYEERFIKEIEIEAGKILHSFLSR